MGIAQKVRTSSTKCDLEFRYPSAINDGRDYSGIPLISYKDGSVCWEATDYIIHYHFQNPGRKESTLDKYARQLSRIVSFLEHRSMSFNDLTDDDLFELTKYLQDEKFSESGKAADNNQVNSILSRLISALQHLSERGYIKPGKLSTTPMVKADVNVELRQFIPRGAKSKRTYFHHPSRLEPNNSQKRRPISDTSLNTLHSAIFKFSDNEFIRSRWANLLQALEHTGARGSEIAGLLVRDVKMCSRQIEDGKNPRLRITTTKGKNAGKSRLVPVPEEFINELVDYTEFHRATVMSHYCEMHDYLFVTQRGSPLNAKRISDHFREVRDFAGLKSSEALPHLCRNRFITLHVKERLALLMERQGNYSASLEDFVVKKVKLLTGHVSDSSLWGYVDDAIHELEIFDSAESKLENDARQKARERKFNSLLGQARSVISVHQKAKILDEMVEIATSDKSKSITFI